MYLLGYQIYLQVLKRADASRANRGLSFSCPSRARTGDPLLARFGSKAHGIMSQDRSFILNDDIFGSAS